MRKIEAIIRPTKVDHVKTALEEAGFESLTQYDVKGRGKQKGVVQQWRGRKYCVDMLPKSKIEMIVSNNDVDTVIDIIQKTAATGEIGDGKIFVSPVETVIRIRTGERDENAL